MKAWPIDPLVFMSFKLGVSENLPQGQAATSKKDLKHILNPPHPSQSYIKALLSSTKLLGLKCLVLLVTFM